MFSTSAMRTGIVKVNFWAKIAFLWLSASVVFANEEFDAEYVEPGEPTRTCIFTDTNDDGKK